MKCVKDANIRNKKIILRVDYNVPISNNTIQDDHRIKESLNTINYLLQNNCSIILLSHMGKIKTEEDKEKYNLEIVYKRLKELINTNIQFSKDTKSEELTIKAKNLKPKEILLIQNTRYEDLPNKLESNNDNELSKYWASLGEIFIMDAFGASHRKHASTYGISKYIPTYIGFLIEKETKILDEAINNKNKTIILGGAKVEDKLKLINKLIPNCNKMLIGGGMCFTFLNAKGNNIGKSIFDETNLNNVKELLNKYKDKIILPIDIKTKQNKIKKTNELNNEDIGLDIGPNTIKEFTKYLNTELIVWNGPLGYTEEKEFEIGTIKILEYLNKNKIKTIIAGGDTASVANKNNLSFYHISTGGGATLKYLEEGKLTIEDGE